MAVPKKYQSDEVKKYQSRKYGWIFHYNIDTYYGDWFVPMDNANYPPPDKNLFTTQNVDVASWAELAEQKGVQYAVLSVMHVYGFCMWPSQVRYDNIPKHYVGGLTFPANNDPYCVQPGIADQFIVDKFATEFRNRGIEPIPYVNVCHNKYICNGILFDKGQDKLDAYIDYLVDLCLELAQLYDFKCFWLDAYHTDASLTMQPIYDALKNYDPEIQIIGNVIGEMNFSRFPYDIQTTEEYVALNNPNIVSSNVRMHNGEAYYVGQEIIGTPYVEMSQWFDYDDNLVLQPPASPLTGQPYEKLKAISTQEYQGLVNNARKHKRPFLAAILVKKDGSLQQHTIDYYDNIDFGVLKKSSIINQLI